jgi:hypothetical protein
MEINNDDDGDDSNNNNSDDDNVVSDTVKKMRFTMRVQTVQDCPVFSAGSFLFLYQP